MTNEDWNKLKEWWGNDLYSLFNLQVDGYKITLQHRIHKMKIKVWIYVDGYLKGEWLSVENEIAKRFLQRKKTSVYSTKKLKESAKLFGKKHKSAQQRYIEYIDVSWSSFTSFKRHLIANNTSIELVKDNEK